MVGSSSVTVSPVPPMRSPDALKLDSSLSSAVSGAREKASPSPLP